MDVKALARSYHLKGDKIAWLLGAGVSTAAGVPTAWQLTWEFKRLFFCSEQNLSPKLCSDLGDAATRDRIQAFFNARGGTPAADSEQEYSYYFELAYPRAQDRQAYIEREFTETIPTYGHQVLAALMRIGRARLLFTTNFDCLVERAFEADADGSLALKTATLDSAQLALRHLQNDQFPLLVKLHGDFRSERLKNVSDELKEQDAQLRLCLTEAARRFGLIVAGYSGRDESIMRAIREALSTGLAFPHGLFWLHKAGRPVLAPVAELIAAAKAARVDAHLLEVGTFDEVMRDFVVLETDIPEVTRQRFRNVRPVLGAGALPSGGKRWPVTRVNALKILTLPTTCRAIKDVKINAREIADRVRASSGRVAAIRYKREVWAFGNDTDLADVFRDAYAGPLDVVHMQRDRFFSDSATQSLLYQLIVSGICRKFDCLEGRTGRRAKVLVRPPAGSSATLRPLALALAGAVTGTLPSRAGQWTESLRLGVDGVGKDLALLITPWVEMVLPPDTKPSTPDKEFVRERIARRYNKVTHELLNAWVQILSGGSETIDLDMGPGLGVVRLLAKSGYAWRLS